jgi:hypothetical protein
MSAQDAVAAASTEGAPAAGAPAAGAPAAPAPATGAPAPPPPTLPSFPYNRVVTLLGPFIAVLAGAIATWLSQNFPGLVPAEATTANTITQGIVFVIGAGIAWALQHKWLDGWQKWEGLVGGASTAPASPAPPADALNLAALAALAAVLPVAGEATAPAVNGAGSEHAGLGVPGH